MATAITTSQRKCCRWWPCLPLPLLVLAPPACALDWLVQPSMRLRQSYTDNALLAPSGQQHADFITEIAPGIALLGNSPRLQVHLDASWRKFLARRSSGSDRQQLQASGHADLIGDWLQLDARASISEQSISPFGAPLIGDLPSPANHSTVRAASISPVLRHAFRALGTAELRYTRSQVSSNDNLLSSHSDEAALQFASIAHGRGWNWHAGYEVRRTQDSRLASQRMERASAGLRYPLNRSWAATAGAGTEKEGYDSSDSNNAHGRFWSLGAIWTPSPRTSVAFSTGRRFFGRTYSLDARLLQRHTSWSLQYSEDITTLPAQFLRLGNRDAASLLDQLWRTAYPDAAERRLRIEAFLRYAGSLGEPGALNYFSHRYFLQKQLTVNMARATPKTTWLAGLHALERSARSASGVDSGLLPGIDLDSAERTRQLGASSSWQWRSSPRNSLRVDAGYASIRSLTTARRDDNLTFTGGVSRIVQPKMTASIEVRHTRHHSNRGGSFRENGMVATLTMQF